MKLYLIPRPFAQLTIAFLTVAGLTLVAASVVQWPAMHIQTLLGNLGPLLVVATEMASGLFYLTLAWVWHRLTRN